MLRNPPFNMQENRTREMETRGAACYPSLGISVTRHKKEHGLPLQLSACRWLLWMRRRHRGPGEVTCAGRATSQSSTAQICRHGRDGPMHQCRACVEALREAMIEQVIVVGRLSMKSRSTWINAGRYMPLGLARAAWG